MGGTNRHPLGGWHQSATLEVGDEATRKIIVKADQPFAIQDVQATDNGFSFSIPKGKKKLHLLPARYQATRAGTQKGEIVIQTDLAGAASGTIKTLVETVEPSSGDDRR